MTSSPEAPPPANLDEAKKIVQQEFLGTSGIHAVGMTAAKNAVRVYADTKSATLDAAVSAIATRCAPFAVELIIEDRAYLISATKPDRSKDADDATDR